MEGKTVKKDLLSALIQGIIIFLISGVMYYFVKGNFFFRWVAPLIGCVAAFVHFAMRRVLRRWTNHMR